MDAVTERRQIEQAYDEFSRVIGEGGAPLQRRVGYQGGSVLADLLWFEDLQLWVLLQPERCDNRYWCAYGIDDPRPASMLGITCEINPPKEGINRSCAGLFVRDQGGTSSWHIAAKSVAAAPASENLHS